MAKRRKLIKQLIFIKKYGNVKSEEKLNYFKKIIEMTMDSF